MTELPPFALLGAHAALGLALYVAGHVGTHSRVEPVARGALALVNAATSAAALVYIGAPWQLAALPAAVAGGAAWPPLCRSPGYTRVLAWTGLVLPTAWPATIPGLVGAIASLAMDRRAHGGFEPSAASLVVYGGPLFLFPCGYNLGNVIFIHADLTQGRRSCDRGLMAHEAGHTLNVAAFGYVFHYVGALHENVWPPPGGAGSAAYAERLAESRRRAPGVAWVDVWAPRKM